MERYIVDYNDNKMEVLRDAEGKCLANIPIKSNNGRCIVFHIPEKGWHYYLTAGEKQEYYTKVSLLPDDTTIEYSNDIIPERRRATLDTTSQNPIFPHDIGRELKSIKTQIEALQEIEELRKRKLGSVLYMLGSSISGRKVGKMDVDYNYKALSRIGEELENYVNLIPLYKKETDPKNGDTVISFNEEISKEERDESIKQVEQELEADVDFIRQQDDLGDRARDLLEDYGKGMDKKISPEERKNYEYVLNKTFRLILGLNYDLIDPEKFYGLSDLTGLQGEELQDKISAIIDWRPFDEACNIEDRFMISESDRFVEKVNEIKDSDISIATTGIGKSLEELGEEVLESNKDRVARDKQYKKYNKIIENKKEIRFKRGRED